LIKNPVKMVAARCSPKILCRPDPLGSLQCSCRPPSSQSWPILTFCDFELWPTDLQS